MLLNAGGYQGGSMMTALASMSTDGENRWSSAVSWRNASPITLSSARMANWRSWLDMSAAIVTVGTPNRRMSSPGDVAATAASKTVWAD